MTNFAINYFAAFEFWHSPARQRFRQTTTKIQAKQCPAHNQANLLAWSRAVDRRLGVPTSSYDRRIGWLRKSCKKVMPSFSSTFLRTSFGSLLSIHLGRTQLRPCSTSLSDPLPDLGTFRWQITLRRMPNALRALFHQITPRPNMSPLRTLAKSTSARSKNAAKYYDSTASGSSASAGKRAEIIVRIVSSIMLT